MRTRVLFSDSTARSLNVSVRRSRSEPAANRDQLLGVTALCSLASRVAPLHRLAQLAAFARRTRASQFYQGQKRSY